MACLFPTHSKTQSAPPRVRSFTASATLPSLASTKCVAPNWRATASLSGFASTATIVPAPTSRSAWIALSPMPPTPITTARSPASTCTRLNTAPAPVSTPQPIRQAEARGTSFGIGTACVAFTSVSSAKDDTFAKA